MAIYGLVSTYNEQPRLLAGAVASLLPACDRVAVFEGPTDDEAQLLPPPPSALFHGRAVVPPAARYLSDADKRDQMLGWAKARHDWEGNRRKLREPEPLWVLWVDADEVLLWGEYLPDMVGRAEAETGAGGFPLRLVELDGSVALCHNRVVRADFITRYLHAAYQVELTSGMVVALPNVKICTAGGLPVKPEEGWVMEPTQMDAWLAKHRPPLAGEPHVLHRSVFRDPSRTVRRLSDVEQDWFKDTLAEQGLAGVDG